jgi:hypothetical protein
LLAGLTQGVNALPQSAAVPPAGSVQGGIELLGVQQPNVGCGVLDERQQSFAQGQGGCVEFFAPLQSQLQAHAHPGPHEEAGSACGQGVGAQRCSEYVKGLEHGLILLTFLVLGILVTAGLEGLWFAISWPMRAGQFLYWEWRDWRAEVAHG